MIIEIEIHMPNRLIRNLHVVFYEKESFFVHDGINSVADYNSLRVGVSCWMDVWMSPCKFHDWITSERLEILS